MHAARCLLLLAFLVVSNTTLPAGEPVSDTRELLGLHLQMNAAQARARLEAIGVFVRSERKGQQIWSVRDPHFAHVIVAIDKEDRVRFITAVARTDAEAQRLRYDEVGPLDQARQAGDPKINNFNFQWTLDAREAAPGLAVVARGRDPIFLDTLSLKRLTENAAPEEE